MACGTLVPWPGIKPAPPGGEAQSLNHWTTREVPKTLSLGSFIYMLKKISKDFSAACKPVFINQLVNQSILPNRYFILTISLFIPRLRDTEFGQQLKRALLQTQFPGKHHLHSSSISFCASGHRAVPFGFQDRCLSLEIVILVQCPPLPNDPFHSHLLEHINSSQ